MDDMAPSPDVIDLQSVRRVMFAPVPAIDESLIGLVRRCALENEIPSSEHIIREATRALRACDNLAVRPDLDGRALAHAMRLPFEEVERRLHARPHPDCDRSLVDFFGATVPISDLALSSRTVAPSMLNSPRGNHHRAIWCHVGVPFDRTSGEHLIDRCPSCECKLAWGGGGPLTLCNMCGGDVRVIPSRHVPKRGLRAVAPLTGLLEPDPAVRARDCAGLHPELLAIDRGAAFELGWRIGRALTSATYARRTAARSIPVQERIDALEAGVSVLHDWPNGISDCARRLLAQGGPRGLRLLRTIRAVSGDGGEWPCLKMLLRATCPELADHGRQTAKALHPGHLDGAGVARFLGVRANRLPLLQKEKILVPVWSSGSTRVHSLYLQDGLAPLRDAIADSVGIGTAAEALGIGHHGVEQLIVLGILPVLDVPGLEIVHKGRRVSRTGLALLLDRLERLPRTEGYADDPTKTLREAMVHVGGREKPWGPVFKALLAGSLTARRRTVRSGVPAVDAITVAGTDVTRIRDEVFDRRDHSGFRFSSVMPTRDATSLFNVNPRGLQAALSDELKPCIRKGGLAIEPSLSIARTRIGGSEIIARFLKGSRRLPLFLRSGKLSRIGPLGWEREPVEQAFEALLGTFNGHAG